MRTEPEYRRRHNETAARANEKWLRKPENFEADRRSKREYQRRRREEDSAAVNEQQRMAYRLRREREGKPVREGPTVIDGTQPRKPAGLFRAWFLAYQEATGESTEALATSLGITPARVRAVIEGRQERVALDVVDRALVNAERIVRIRGREIVRLDDLYYPEEAA